MNKTAKGIVGLFTVGITTVAVLLLGAAVAEIWVGDEEAQAFFFLAQDTYPIMKQNLERRINMRYQQKSTSIILDLIMTIITGGVWLIWVAIRYMRTH